MDFENQLSFHSLRKEIDFKEALWLQRQGDGDWDLKADPDGHFIIDDVERTFLNVANEFIIGKTVEDYKIYKLYENAVVIFDWSELDIVKKINLGILTPSQLFSNLDKYDGKIRIKVPDSFIGIDPFVPNVPDYGPCKERNDIRYTFNTSNKRRIKTISKFHDPIFLIRDNSIKAKTKVFKKSRLLGWIPANATISVKLDCYGNTEASVGDCVTSNKLLWSLFQSKTRHKVKVKAIIQHGDIRVVKNKIRSTHQHSGHVKRIDFYDGSIKHL